MMSQTSQKIGMKFVTIKRADQKIYFVQILTIINCALTLDNGSVISDFAKCHLRIGIITAQ